MLEFWMLLIGLICLIFGRGTINSNEDLFLVIVGISLSVAGFSIMVIQNVLRKHADRVIKATFRIHYDRLSDEELEEVWNARKDKFLNL